MKKVFITVLFIIPYYFAFGQDITPYSTDPVTQSVVFSYDDAGNQIYRGPTILIAPRQTLEEGGDQNLITESESPVITNEGFWNEVEIYPVPVKDILTIRWTDKANNMISEVSLYEQNTVHWKFQQQNLPNLNQQIRIDMTDYYMGVYILTFQLKDGSIMTKNITKF